MAENDKNSKLLVFFNMLEEIDKDIVISIAESLAEKYRMSITKKDTQQYPYQI